MRCAPQVNGATRDTWARAETVAAAELRSAIDNPVVLPDGRVESCGNFHGAPLALACDFLAIAAAEVGAIAERRTDRMLDSNRSYGLPPFLTEDAGSTRTDARALHPGRDGGREPPTVRARERRFAAYERHAGRPRVDGLGAARKLRTVVANLGCILAVELTCAARALVCAPRWIGAGTAAALAAVRVIPGPGPDRWLAPELAEAEALVASGAVVEAVEGAIGSLE